MYYQSYSDLYTHDLYSNKLYPYIIGRNIVEYDMEEAGYSLIKEYKLLDQETIDKLASYKKHQRTIEIGKLQINNKSLKKKLSTGFVKARKLFFSINNIEDNEVLAIRKDAIFIIEISKKNYMEEFGEYIRFRKKNVYTSYIKLNNRIECYYKSNTLDIKNLGEENVLKHKDYMIDFIKKFMNRLEKTTSYNRNAIVYLRNMVDKYKHRELDVGYYRTFNQESAYISNVDKNVFEDIGKDDLEDIDISFNLIYILLPLFRIII